MVIITKENLKAVPNGENAYQNIISINGQTIEISIEPDDVDIEETIGLANKIIKKFEHYESQARKIIIQEFLDNYNENWTDEEDGMLELNEKGFNENLTLYAITFRSNCSIDFFYSENGMFGDHSLIAQSFDGENFDAATMFG